MPECIAHDRAMYAYTRAGLAQAPGPGPGPGGSPFIFVEAREYGLDGGPLLLLTLLPARAAPAQRLCLYRVGTPTVHSGLQQQQPLWLAWGTLRLASQQHTPVVVAWGTAVPRSALWPGNAGQ